MSKSNKQERTGLDKVVIFASMSAVSGGLFVLGMIRNGNGAVARYESLQAADQAGGDVEAALNDLRTFIYSHMNTEIGSPTGIYPPIQLKGTYDRLLAAEEQRVKDTNDQLYTQAQEYCEATGNQGFSGRNRLDCINGYIDQNGAKVKTIEDSLYKYDFVSPRWSPDLAGFSLIALVLFAFLTVLYGAMYLRTKHFIHLSK